MMTTTARRRSARWAPLLVLAGIVAACQPTVTPTADAPASAPAPTPTPAAPPEPAEPQASCDDLAIRLLDLGAGIHGAIVADTLHMGGAAAPVTCADPANLSLLARLSIPDDWTAQVQQSQYYLIVIRYPGGNRLYVISRRSDGTSCVVDTNDQCIAQVTELPDGFDLDDLPDDVAPTIPAGRPAPEPPAATDTAPATAGNPQPRDGATGVAVETLLLSWSAADRAASYDVYWGREEHLTADADLGTPLATTFTATTIRRPALGTTYYWRVDAKNDQGTTTGSVWSFTTADQAAPPPPGGGGYTPPVAPAPSPEPPPPERRPGEPGAPGNPQPRDGATGVSIHGPRLSWSAVPGGGRYVPYLARQEWRDELNEDYPDWHRGAKSEGSTHNTFIQFGLGWPHPASSSLLRSGYTYYWRVDVDPNMERYLGYFSPRSSIREWKWRCPEGKNCDRIRGHVWSFTTKTYTKPHVSLVGKRHTMHWGQWTHEANAPGNTVTFGVVLVRPKEARESWGETVYFEYATEDGTATAGVDYESTSGRVRFFRVVTQRSGAAAYTYDHTSDLTITLKGPLQDNVKEEDETFRVTARAYYYRPGPGLVEEEVDCERCTATITILDDD